MKVGSAIVVFLILLLVIAFSGCTEQEGEPGATEPQNGPEQPGEPGEPGDTTTTITPPSGGEQCDNRATSTSMYMYIGGTLAPGGYKVYCINVPPRTYTILTVELTDLVNDFDLCVNPVIYSTEPNEYQTCIAVRGTHSEAIIIPNPSGIYYILVYDYSEQGGYYKLYTY